MYEALMKLRVACQGLPVMRRNDGNEWTVYMGVLVQLLHRLSSLHGKALNWRQL
jgi:hypothetical protein